MRTVLVLAVAGLVVLVSGCALFDALTGYDPNTGNRDPSGGPAATVGSLVGAVIPWAGTVIGALATAYVEIRRRQYLAAAGSLARGINAVRARGETVSTADMIGVLKDEQEKDGIRGVVRKIVHWIEGK